MEYRILGPVEAVVDGRALDLGGPLERAVLARLLLSPGRAVSPSQLVDDLWEGEPPGSAQVSLRVRVSRLRKALASAGADDVLRTEAAGYVIQLRDGDRLDVRDFEVDVRHGRDSLKRGAPEDAARRFDAALQRWRGPALAGLEDVPFVRVEAVRLEEERLAAIADRMDARLALGQHAEVVSELDALCARNPLHERLWAQWMLALYRCGRQADALAASQRLRTVLSEELGIDPSPELVDLERRMLKHAPELGAAASPHGRRLPSGVVTFLLTEIDGFSQLCEENPRAINAALERCRDVVRRAVEANEGHFLRCTAEDGGTMSVFQRASDAVRAAAGAHAAIAAEQWPDALPVRVRMGVHTGEAQEHDGDFAGPAVSRAARIRGFARGGQILLSQATCALVHDHLPAGVDLEDAGERALRGVRHGEHVFAVRLRGEDPAAEARQQEALPRPPLPEPLATLMGGRFVGRQPALARLGAAYAAASTGTLRCTFVAGEPGIGKTRLTAEFAAAAHRGGAVVLYGQCDEDPVVPYQPFVEALRPWVAAQTPSQRAAIAGAEHLVNLVPELAVVAAAQPRDDPEVERYRLFEAVAATLASAAAGGPLVLVLDDLHWADRPTLQLLRHVMHSRAGLPLLIIGTYRGSGLGRTRPLASTLGELSRERGFDRTVLGGLDESEILSLVEPALGNELDGRGRALARALCESTDGNPFFIEQVLGNLLDSGSLVQREGRTVLEDRIEELVLPEGVVDAVGRRLSRLSESCNQALTAGSVLGRDFDLDVLRRMLDQEPEAMLAPIEEAIDAGLVRELPASGRRARVSFVHALVQQALYSELSLARKQRLHLRAAAAIEAEHANDLEQYVLPLARHLRAAGAAADPAKTIDYSVKAMRVAARVFAFDEAIAHGEAALELIEETSPGAAAAAPLLEGLGDLMYVAGGDYARGVARSEEALRRYEAVDDRAGSARMHAKLGRAFASYWGHLDVPRALMHLEDAERLLGSAPDPRTEARLLYSKIMVVALTQGTEEGAALATRVRDIGREAGDERIYAMGTALHGLCMALAGRHAGARALIEEAWTIGDRLDSGASFVATWGGGLFLVFSDARDCYRLLSRELDRPRRLQPSNIRWVLLGGAQDALQLSGDLEAARRVRAELQTGTANLDPLPQIRYEFLAGSWERARHMAERCVAEHRGRGNWVMATLALYLLADVLQAEGAIDQATAAYESLAQLGPVPWWGDYGAVGRLKFAALEAMNGNLAAARANLAAAERYIAESDDARGLMGHLERARGVVAASEGRQGDAESAFARAAETFERHGFPFEHAATLHAWAKALVAAGDSGGADAKVDAALELYRGIGAGAQWAEVVLAGDGTLRGRAQPAHRRQRVKP